MLKTLCRAVNEPACTNHQVRVTSIQNLRRDGWDWLDIAKISGNFKREVANVVNKFPKLRAQISGESD